MASSSNRAAISNLTWLADNETIMFLGERPRETPQLYRVNCSTKRLEKLTDHPTQIVAFAANKQGDRFVFTAKTKLPAVISDDMLRRGFAVTSQSWTDLYMNGPPPLDSRQELFVKGPSMDAPKRIGGTLELYREAYAINLQVSPDGKYALLSGNVLEPPEHWKEYSADVFAARGRMRTCKTGEAWPCPMQYLLVDLDSGTIGPLMDAPIIVPKAYTASGLAAWTQRNSILLVNALLPLEGVNREERMNRQVNAYVAEVTVPDRQILKIKERLQPYPAHYIRSSDNSDKIVTLPWQASDGPPLEFRYEKGRWNITEIASGSIERGDLAVTLEQDMNTPPTLVVTDPRTQRKARLLDLNPQFAGLMVGRVEQFEWKAKDGHDMNGLIYYPPDFTPGKRYPLVIQTHGFSRDRFWIVGPYNTGFAAQPLVNKGFIVLQLDDAPSKDVNEWFNTSGEAPHELAAYEAAIDALYNKGLIDRSRVALSGFSRTVYHVLYTLTHSNYHIAAATLSDGVNFGYTNCVYFPLAQSTCERINGGPPYGATLSNWAKESPTFRLDRVEAPLLLQAIGAPFYEWEILSGLRWLKKPVEMLNFYPEGEHSLTRPQQRLLSQGTVVDWYCFWLKGEEDPDPAKAEQYKRWRELRKLQEKNEAARVGSKQ